MSNPLELSRPKYIAMLERQREGIEALTHGLREYLIADIDADLSEMENQPANPNAVQRLTEDLMTANLAVQLHEENMRIFHETFANLSPEFLAYLAPYESLINGLLLPLLNGHMQKLYLKATRQRDDIQAELMEYEAPEPTA